MSTISRIVAGLFLAGYVALLYGMQGPTTDFERELAAGKLAAQQGEYDQALAHFSSANQVQGGKCSDCYVWLARVEMAGGKLDQALAEIDGATASAATGTERAAAQLYRGLILGRQGNLAAAEAAFRSASSANPHCVECRFNLGFVLLKESQDAEAVKVLKSVATDFSGTPRGREIQRFIADPSRARKNYAPEFSAKLRNGEEVNLDTLKGKVVLLDFWGTWCTACRVSLPLLKQLAAGADPAKLAVISIDEGDPKPKWEQFVQENGMTWAQVYDADRSIYRAFGVDAFPRYFILSKDGIVLQQFKGWNQNGSAITEAISRALKQ